MALIGLAVAGAAATHIARPRMSDERDERAPDFAMLRAVEILARIAETNRAKRNVPPAPIDRPVVLANENLTFAVGTHHPGRRSRRPSGSRSPTRCRAGTPTPRARTASAVS